MSSTDIDNLKNLFNIIQAHSNGKASGSVTMYESPINDKDKYKEIFEPKSVDEDKLKNALKFLVAVSEITKDNSSNPKTKTFKDLLDGDLKGLISYEKRTTPYGTVTLLKTNQALADTKKTDLHTLFAANHSATGDADYAHTTLKAKFGKDLSNGTNNLNTNADALVTLKVALDLLAKAPLDKVSANKAIVAQIKKLTDFTTTVQTPSPSSNWESTNLPSMSGGARNFVGEFEAYKNTMNMERSSIKMIGGGSDVWAPGLEKDATRRSTLFAQVFSSVKAELAKHKKALSPDDSKAIEAAINSLAKRESNIYGELKTLNKYAQLLDKYKDVKDGDVVKALKKQTNISALVSQYFKNVARADKKSSKLGAVFGSLMMSLPGGLLVGL